MAMPDTETGNDPVFNYHLLRNTLEHYQRKPSALEHAHYQQALGKAQRSYRMESLVLAAPEAEGLVIPDSQLDAAVHEVASRYPNSEEFEDDLMSNGLDRDALREALRRELTFDAVMQKVGAKAADVNDIDMRLFYEMHAERFETPELRSARHILITVNPDYLENTRPVALERANKLAEKLRGRANRFSDIAKRHSECPTAMEGGKLGEVKRGTLYPQLDEALFALEEGQVSDIVESEIGFHVLLCEKIKPAKRTPFSKAAPRIEELLRERRQRNCQKAFLSALQKAYDA
jgi:peptidyl-prolyl cis-trans isomerase C